MIPWVELDSADAPGGGCLRLMRRGGEFSITVDGGELMNSRRGGSEQALAALACAHLRGRDTPRLLIGGLGLGFTLRAALSALGSGAQVEVAEISPAVLDWAAGPLAGLFDGALTDARVTVRLADVGERLWDRASYDAILLDVDNGPGALVRPQNGRLYTPAGLAAFRSALRPGGVLAVWSAAPDRAFKARLDAGGFEVSEHQARSHRGGGSRHVVWLAAKRGA